MADKYKLVVIGAGPGGYVAAIRAAQLGVKTAIVEKEYLGGVCLNWGCIPSKALLYVTELKRTIEHGERLGIKVDNIDIDVDKLKKHKNDTVKRLTGGVKVLLEKAGVDIIMGEATFLSKNEIQVKSEGKKSQIEADNFIIATGAGLMQIPTIKTDGERIIGAREAIEIPYIPKKMGVIGAGPIGTEMATVYNSFGAEVTIIEMMDSVLPMLDKDISTAAEKAFKKQKMEILTSSKVVESNRTPKKVEVKVETPDGAKDYKFDMVLVAAGMVPNTGTLGLDKAGVKTDKKGFIEVNNKMQTSVPNIYSIGDVAGGLLLAHKASHEGVVAAENVSGANHVVDWKAVPYAVFTDPEIAAIGMTEDEAKEKGRKVKVGKFPYRALGKAIATLAQDGFTKVISDADTDEILGVHIFGPHSGDILYAGTAVMEFDGTSEDLGQIMAIHPTLSEGLMEAGLNVHKKAIHIVN